MKRASGLIILLIYVIFYVILPSLVLYGTYVLLNLNLDAEPFIIIGLVIVPMAVGIIGQNILSKYIKDTSKGLKFLLLYAIPIIFLLLIPVYDAIVYIFIETSPLMILTSRFNIDYLQLESRNILPQDSKTIFTLFFMFAQYSLVHAFFFGSSFYHKVSPTAVINTVEPVKATKGSKPKVIIKSDPTEYLDEGKHNHRSGLLIDDFKSHTWIAIILGFLVFILSPIFFIFLVPIFAHKQWYLGVILVAFIGLMINLPIIKYMILFMNRFEQLFRVLLFILIPGSITALFLLKGMELPLFHDFGNTLDIFFVSWLKIPSEQADIGMIEVVQYIMVGIYGEITLVGLNGFSKKCFSCNAWYDPYRVSERLGLKNVYTVDTNTYKASGKVSKVYDSGYVDVDVDVEKVKTETAAYTVEGYEYECIKCGRKESFLVHKKM